VNTEEISNMPTSKIYYIMRQSKAGPYSKQELVEMWYAGIVQDHDILFDSISNTFRKFKESKEFQHVYPKPPKNLQLRYGQQINIMRTASEINCNEARERSTINISECREKHNQYVDIINLKHKNNVEIKCIDHKNNVEIKCIDHKNNVEIKKFNEQNNKGNRDDSGIVAFVAIIFFFFLMLGFGALMNSAKYTSYFESQQMIVVVFFFIPLIFLSLFAAIAANNKRD
jgi:hypothetical protein